MTRTITGICQDCHEDRNLDVPILSGQIVSKGRRPVKYCVDCGNIISGTPGLGQWLTKKVTGEYPWE